MRWSNKSFGLERNVTCQERNSRQELKCADNITMAIPFHFIRPEWIDFRRKALISIATDIV
ncbi:MAG: hypothetical protein C4563_00045 [Desulfobulbus sp.]|nr:MAG: hypothetical protein C4563_00045 [Desulfobulbus sp.]